MNKLKNWTVGLTLVALLAVGVVALAGSGFGGSGQTASCSQTSTAATGLYECDTDGDGVLNCDDSDWTAQPADGSGFGTGQGYRMNLSDNRPLDGTGYGMHRAGGAAGTGTCGGGCS
jgi:hypothetical protein